MIDQTKAEKFSIVIFSQDVELASLAKFELKKSDHEELDKILASKKYSAAKDSVEIQIIAKKDKRLKSLISKITFAK